MTLERAGNFAAGCSALRGTGPRAWRRVLVASPRVPRASPKGAPKTGLTYLTRCLILRMSVRITAIALGSVALNVAVSSVWCHCSKTMVPPAPPAQKRAARASVHRLKYGMDTTESGAIRIVNQELFAWTDVHVEVGDDESYGCPTLSTIQPGHALVIRVDSCGSAGGHIPTHICVTRVLATQGQIISALEPCARVQSSSLRTP